MSCVQLIRVSSIILLNLYFVCLHTLTIHRVFALNEKLKGHIFIILPE